MISTPKISFIHSRASWQLALLTTMGLPPINGTFMNFEII